MKYKIFMLFFNFWGSFFKMFIIEVAIFYLSKYQISNQHNFFSDSLYTKICMIPYSMDFFEIFNSGRYHRDMEVLKMLASSFIQFRISGIFLKLKIGTGHVPAYIFNTTSSLITSVSNNLWS